MTINKVLNKKQVTVAWIMISLIFLMMIRTIFSVTSNYFSIRVFFNWYLFIAALGIVLIYALRDREKPTKA
ncbi:MAG: hypothetical protein PHF11_04135 [Candidatus Omnitrophica bacterium]|nr:hypothetical protein [Candidatus Omnitrophota bacterium]